MTERTEAQMGHPGRPKPDLGPIHAGNDLRWGYRCLGVGAGDNTCRKAADTTLSKATATAQARAHVRDNPTHRVQLHAVTWQVVYGQAAR